MKRIGILAVIFGLSTQFVLPNAAHAQFLVVDCSGLNPYAFPTIGSALSSAGPGTFIAVTGACNENVSSYGAVNLTLGASFGQTVTLHGNLSISNSQNVYLYGLNVTNNFGDGIDVNGSRSVMLDTCNSNSREYPCGEQRLYNKPRFACSHRHAWGRKRTIRLHIRTE